MELVQQWFMFSAIALLLLLVKKSLKSFKYGPLPPGPRALPIIGNLPIIGDKPHQSLARLAKTYGPLMTVRLGMVPTVVVSSPSVAREILKKRDQDFCSRSPPDAVCALDHHKYAMTFRPVDQHWRDLRKVCSTQLFNSRRIDDRQGLRERKVSELVGFVRARCESGEAVDIGRVAFTTSLNLLSCTILSVDLVDPTSDSPQYFKDLVWGIMEEGGGANISDFFPKLRAFDLNGRRRKMAEMTRKLHVIFDEIIDRRLEARAETGGEVNDFLDSLIQCHVGENEIKLDRPTMRSLILELFVAGSDTTSSTVEWAMAELLRSPKSMAKVRAEISGAVDPAKDLSETDITQFPYLQAVVKETLRLHAPTPLLIPRRTESTVEYGEYTIPKHTRVLVNAWAIGRDPEVWKDAESFIPERFMDSGSVDYKGQDFELIPFGAGRRMCPGLPLGVRMVQMILASMLRTFEWKLADGMRPDDLDMEEKFGITLVKAVPVRAIPVFDSTVIGYC